MNLNAENVRTNAAYALHGLGIQVESTENYIERQDAKANESLRILSMTFRQAKEKNLFGLGHGEFISFFDLRKAHIQKYNGWQIKKTQVYLDLDKLEKDIDEFEKLSKADDIEGLHKKMKEMDEKGE